MKERRARHTDTDRHPPSYGPLLACPQQVGLVQFKRRAGAWILLQDSHVGDWDPGGWNRK